MTRHYEPVHEAAKHGGWQGVPIMKLFFLNHKDKLIQAKKWTAPVPELLFEKLRDNEKYILRLSDLYLVNK